MKESTHSRGNRGEKQAEQALLAAGYTIHDRNYRSRRGEIDLIASKAGCLYFVEVKLRLSGSYGTAAEQVGPAKRRKIAAQAELYLAASGWQGPCGFLTVAIDGTELQIIEDFLL